MDEEVKITETTVEAPLEPTPAEPTAAERLEERLMELMPEEERTGDMAEDALNLINRMVEERDRIIEEREQLIEKISDDPRAAQMFADIVGGVRKPGAAIVRYFGKSLTDAEEGTPEYDELVAADLEFENERNEMKTKREQQQASAKEFFDAFENYLEARGLDKEKYMNAVYNDILEPALDLKVDEILFARLVNAVDYDKDVADALAAGEVRGRNMNINEMRGRIGDGLPKAMGSQGVPVEQPKKKINPLIARALQA